MVILLDGKALAAEVRGQVATAVAELEDQHAFTPRLDAVLVGEDPASEIYVKHKRNDCAQVGIESQLHELPASTSEDELLALIDSLNAEPACDGILVQLPLPAGLDEDAVVERVAPDKDADGFHPVNLGRLLSDRGVLAPATPSGILHLLRANKVPLEGTEAVIVGRSTIVGKPMAALLLGKGASATVTVAHSRTRDLPALTRRADLVIVAVGRPGLLTGEMVREGAVVVDVGITRVDGKLVGDVAFDEVAPRAGAITPVPGGVGPLTRAFLLVNTVRAACLRRGVPVPDGLPAL